MTERFEISRRKALTALGTIGVASAGAGLGTSALFNDSESFENNIVTAGTLDLLVDYYSYWDQGSAGSGSVDGTADGEAVTSELSDVKPGDSGLIAFCPRIQTNPAYLWMCGELTASDENGYTEPEPEDDNDEGELEENIHVDVNYCRLVESNGDGFTENSVETIATAWSGSLAELLVASQTGLPLDGGATVPAGGSFPMPGEQAEFNPDGNPCICLDWEIPTAVENEIQGDSLEFDIQFYAEQARHNDGSSNPCVDETFEAPYINDAGNSTQIEGTLRMDVNYGENSIAYRVQMDDDDGGPKMSDPLNSITNVWIPFDTDDDGTMDFQLQWFPGGGLPDDPFGYKEHSGSWGSIQGLPSGVVASKSGESIVFVVPKSLVGTAGDVYRVGAHMSAGGEAPYAAISTQSGTGEIVPSGDFSSSGYLIQTSVQ